ncbi:MAG: acetylglutamate kinase [Nitrospirota bacterium]|jgi:acetylglutamate kinase
MKELIDKAGVLIEALPYIRSFYGKTFVIKYGGAAQTDEGLKRAFAEDVVLMNFIGIRTVIVHGGGPRINETMQKMGKVPNFVHGHRVTDAETMDIVEMVLGGLINKHIVSLINGQGGKAVGLSGKDGGMIKASRKKLKRGAGDDLVDIGLVGEVEEVNPRVLQSLDKEGFIPVISPIGVGAEGETLNINADSMSSAVASALGAEKLIFLTDVPGIKDKKGKVVETLTRARAKRMISSGAVAGGMIPKVSAALEALEKGVKKTHIVDGRVPHCLLLEIFTHKGLGTEIMAK